MFAQFLATLNKLPTFLKVVLAAGLIIIFSLLLWYRGTQVWNGIGNFFFHRQINAKQAEVQKELDQAAVQKKELEATLLELAMAKKDLEQAKKDREVAELIFNDATKTAKEKIALYEAAMSASPIRTDPTGVTTEDLCLRAKAIGGSQATIDALCSR